LAQSSAWKRRNYEANQAKFRAYQAANIDLVRARRRASEQKRRYAVLATADVNGDTIQKVLDEARFGDRWLDAYSGELITNPTIDHIEPLVRGGVHTYENLCVTSRANNGRKHARSLLVWLAVR